MEEKAKGTTGLIISMVPGLEAPFDDLKWFQEACIEHGVDPDTVPCFEVRAKDHVCALTFGGRFFEDVFLTEDQSFPEDGGSPSGIIWDWTCFERVNVAGVDLWVEFDGGQFWGYPTAEALISDMHGDFREVPVKLAGTVRGAEVSRHEALELVGNSSE